MCLSFSLCEIRMIILTVVDLKQIDCQIFLQPRWIYSGSPENCSLGSATVGSHMQVPEGEGRNTFIEGEKEAGRATVNKEFKAFHWLSPCQERRGVILLPLGLRYYHRAQELPLLVS